MVPDVSIINVTLSDISERKQDLVSGPYDMPAPRKGGSTVVRLPEMMGEQATAAETI
jgi:adenine-specific DNA-methyltransferase